MIRFPTENLSAALLFRDQYGPSRAPTAFALRKQAETRLALDLRNQFVPPPHLATPDPEPARKACPTPWAVKPCETGPARAPDPAPADVASHAGPGAGVDPSASSRGDRSLRLAEPEKPPSARMPYGQPADTSTGRLLDIVA